MAVLDVFRKSSEWTTAEQRLRELEDKVLELQPGEMHETPIHAAVCAKRWQLFNERIKLADAKAASRDARTFVAICILGAIVLLERVPLVDIWNVLAKIF